ncbi:MAG: FAD-binding protein [Bacteroidetes bacterium]|nr:FAD-binding protein [Bacteroidota bacterium]
MTSRKILYNNIIDLKYSIDGDILIDETSRLIYATDASVFREIPLAIVRPKNKEDIKKLIAFAHQEQLSLIPRGAGTSLAGQVVGNGIVVDISRYMTQILEVNKTEFWVRVEPGVVLDELNKYLQPYGLFFGPETSTSNRCTIGGMVGNNACGAHSLIYGSTRDHTLSMKVILSDGSEAEFGRMTNDEFQKKCSSDNLENVIYKNIREILTEPSNQQEIRSQYPDRTLRRRNTGYAIDELLETLPFTQSTEPFNFCKILAGSEGTLAFAYDIKLNLVPLPFKEKVLQCVHFHRLRDAFYGNLIALKYYPGAIELIDRIIIEQTKHNIEQLKNRFFIIGDPAAILIIEFTGSSREELLEKTSILEAEMRQQDLGYHFSYVFGNDINKVWNLRKAGLGLLSNIPGDAKPVAVIEDTAVNPKVLPDYIEELQKLLNKYKLSCTYHAHIATGELHVRPVLNMKDEKQIRLFHDIALETAKLVKKYKGSFSGEHGDGRLRGEFIPLMIGEKNYHLLKRIKAAWDPDNIFNPGKITDTPPITTNLRYKPGQFTRDIPVFFDYTTTMGFQRAVEQCNGSGDCRKSALIGGTMCPSYMATMDENLTTRARANILREFISNSTKKNPFNHREIYDILDLCLSCKGCKAECPSSVDITKYKAEFLQHYYDKHIIPFRTRAIANVAILNKVCARFPAFVNFLMSKKISSKLIKWILGFAAPRTMPLLFDTTMTHWAGKNHHLFFPSGKYIGKVYFFADEFTEYYDTSIGIKAVQLLTHLGYEVQIPHHKESGRSFLSKGLVRKAKKLANRNVELLHPLISKETPLVGIEPSTILTFRDEYPELVRADLRIEAKNLSAHVFMLDEFIANEIKENRIIKEQFTRESRHIMLHGHCHQKALSSTTSSKEILSLPENYTVEEIPSGCCGMAGSFGFEKEHYEMSMKVGELILFPAVRKATSDVLIAATGTSCRHHIKDGTGRIAYHPVEILYDALLR